MISFPSPHLHSDLSADLSRHICSDIASRTDSKVDHLFVLMNKLQLSLGNQPTPSSYVTVESPNVARLRRIAQKVLATASTVISARSSFSDGSFERFRAASPSGHAFERHERNNIEPWVQQLIRVEEEAESVTMDPAISSSSEEFESTDIISPTGHDSTHSEVTEPESIEHEFNPEEDFNLDLMLSLARAGKKHFDNSNPEQAKENLDLSLQYAKKLTPRRYSEQSRPLTEVRLMLGSIYLQRRELKKAHDHLVTLVKETAPSNDNRLLLHDAQYKLARVYLLEKNFDNAQVACQKCMQGRGRLLGKESQPYFEAIQLLVLIYHGKGSHLEADVMLQKLPKDLHEETASRLQAPNAERSSMSLAAPPVQSHHDRNRSLSLFRKRTSGEVSRSQCVSPDFTSQVDHGLLEHPHSSVDHSRTSEYPRDMGPQALLSLAGFNGDFDNAKALIWAVVENQLRVVHYLLEGYPVYRAKKSKLGLSGNDSIEIKKAKVDGSASKSKRFPLMVAIECGRVMVAKLLLDRGASTSIKDEKHRSPLRAAAEGGHAEIVKLLLAKGAWVESFDPRTGSKAFAPIHGAAANGHDEVVKLLIDSGSAVDSRDGHGASALKVAAQRGREAVVQLLIEKGASVDAADDGGWTSLMAASFNGHEHTTRLLLRSKASINKANLVGQTALMIAAEQGHENVTKILLNSKAEVELRDDAGWTAIISAANKGHIHIITLLLGAGANMNVQSNLESTALDRAKYRQDRKLVKFLKDNGAKHGSRRFEKQLVTPFTGYAI